METLFGGLFEYRTDERLTEFIENANKDDAFKIIEIAITHCQNNGAFTIDESYILYKMLKKIKEK